MNNVGYSFLRQPKATDRNGDPIPVENLGLTELRPYMCPLSSGDFRRCINCKGISKCTVGQRIALLVGQQEAKQSADKWRKVLDVADAPGKINQAGTNVVQVTSELLRRACESGNAWNHIMQVTGKSKNAAKELLIELIRKYPAIAAEYGGSRRILQRPAVVMVESEVEPAPREETAPAPEAAPSTTNDARKSNARKLWEECMAAEDPYAHYMEVRGTNHSAARSFFYRMQKKYGLEKPKPVEAEPAEKAPEESPKEEPAPAEDEISLEDFLAQFEPGDPGAELAPEEPPSETEADDVADVIRRAAIRAVGALDSILMDGSASNGEKIQAADAILRCFSTMYDGR